VLEHDHDVLSQGEYRAEEPDPGVEGVGEHDVEGSREVSAHTLEEACGRSDLVLGGPLGLMVDQEFPAVSGEHRADVAVVVLGPRSSLRGDLARETAGTAPEEAGRGLVPVEDQDGEAMRWRGKRLVSLEACVLLEEETPEILRFEEGLDASQGVRTGDLVSRTEGSPPDATMSPELLQGVETAKSRKQHDEERQEDIA